MLKAGARNPPIVDYSALFSTLYVPGPGDLALFGEELLVVSENLNPFEFLAFAWSSKVVLWF